MMMTTPSTASSPSRVKAPRTSSCDGTVTGMSAVAYPSWAADRATASRVRMLPVVDMLNKITPSVRNSPRFSARAALLGR